MTTNIAQGNSDSQSRRLPAAAQGIKPGVARKGLAEMVERQMEEIAKALPPGIMTPERFARIVLTEFRKNPSLLACTPESFLGALFQTAQLGLEPGGSLGHAFLIPYKNGKLTKERGYDVWECQLQIGYKGYIELAGRRGIIMRAREVHKNDRFAFDLGTDEHLTHSWALGDDRGDVVGFWGKAVMPDGRATFTVMDTNEVNERRDRSSAVQYARRQGLDEDAGTPTISPAGRKTLSERRAGSPDRTGA